jgi:predicted Zn-dependent protease
MKKILLQGVLIIVSFTLLWFSLSRIDWISLFAIKKATAKTEEKLGKLFWEVFEKNEKENKDPFVSRSIDSIISRICDANEIERNSLKIHILINDDVNAFALPDGHLVIHTGLILSSENAEGLCGVIAHEIAHIERKHVMKKLIKEIGLSVLISMTTGGGGTEAAKDAVRILSSSAFDRTLEKEADITAVDYLIKAKVDPEDFANFLYMIAETEENPGRFLTWMSTHPDSKERGNYIIEYAKGKNTHYQKVIDDDTWRKMIRTIQNE